MKLPAKLRPILVLAAVFVLGAGSGAALMRVSMLRDLEATMDRSPGRARARFRLEAMRRHLDLSEKQGAKIEAILIAAEEKRASLTEPCRPKLEELRADVERQLAEVLTPEQQAAHEAFRDKLRERRKRHGGRRHRGHGPR